MVITYVMLKRNKFNWEWILNLYATNFSEDGKKFLFIFLLFLQVIGGVS